VADVIRVNDHYYILATSSRADEGARVLKHDDTFAILDRYGDIQPFGLREQGLYFQDTRHLSSLELRLDDERPLLLSSTVGEDNDLFAVDLTNPDLVRGGVLLPRDVLHLFRAKFLWQGACYERLRITHYGLAPAQVSLSLRFDADFADIFEVRGTRRARRGRLLPAELAGGDTLVLAYEGLDGVRRRTCIRLAPPPAVLEAGLAWWDLRLAPGETTTLYVTIGCERAPAARAVLAYEAARAEANRVLEADKRSHPHLYSTNEQFNDWTTRSMADVHMMLTSTPFGPYPYAGVPWFSTAFGRDGILTALELLWLWPDVARGVLRFLAAHQATASNPEQDAQPGKILHELRGGEMAALGEVPFGRYYGSVDATPLFVVLAGAYYARTGDRATIDAVWGAIERALEWIDRWGDADGDGFVEYARMTPQGLAHQGWKDSQDAVFHADGTLAPPPIALCEVQGYVYAARRAAARLAAARGDAARARALGAQARRLREAFERAFWCEELGTYALALDGAKRPCRVRTSNAGHLLFTGIAGAGRAARVAEGLFGEPFFSGWGIRTLAATEPRYNPMSYHNGSVWPHDNAIIAAGLARYGLTGHAVRLLKSLFDASLFTDLHRMPELFCGFPRRKGQGPTLYPVACAPQAWSAAAVFLLLQASLGLSIDAPRGQIRLAGAQLPDFLDAITISSLQVGASSFDLRFERHEREVVTKVLRRSGDVRILSIS
jgi:glycogen debranching enzyme